MGGSFAYKLQRRNDFLIQIRKLLLYGCRRRTQISAQISFTLTLRYQWRDVRAFFFLGYVILRFNFV